MSDDEPTFPFGLIALFGVALLAILGAIGWGLFR